MRTRKILTVNMIHIHTRIASQQRKLWINLIQIASEHLPLFICVSSKCYVERGFLFSFDRQTICCDGGGGGMSCERNPQLTSNIDRTVYSKLMNVSLNSFAFSVGFKTRTIFRVFASFYCVNINIHLNIYEYIFQTIISLFLRIFFHLFTTFIIISICW